MKRIISVLAIAALMAAFMVVSAMPAFAQPNPANNGNTEGAPAETAPGQENNPAAQKCSDVVRKQKTNTNNGKGKKRGEKPTNCDHFFQNQPQ